MSTKIENLNNDCLEKVFKYLGLKEFNIIRQVNKQWLKTTNRLFVKLVNTFVRESKSELSAISFSCSNIKNVSSVKKAEKILSKNLDLSVGFPKTIGCLFKDRNQYLSMKDEYEKSVNVFWRELTKELKLEGNEPQTVQDICFWFKNEDNQKKLSDITHLELDCLELSLIPVEMRYLKNLKKLTLVDTSLQSFGCTLTFLENLEELNFINTPIDEKIFSSIRKLKKLRVLQFVNTRVTTIPDDLRIHADIKVTLQHTKPVNKSLLTVSLENEGLDDIKRPLENFPARRQSPGSSPLVSSKKPHLSS